MALHLLKKAVDLPIAQCCEDKFSKTLRGFCPRKRVQNFIILR